MEKDYLVILSSHVDSEDKKNILINTLKILKNQGIHVCVSTHSSMYLDEISKNCKYLIYDSNNEYINFNDFLINSEGINENVTNYGYNTYTLYHSFGKVIQHFPGSLHSKAALILLKNGINLSKSYNYKWSIYLEYDIKEPINGFRKLFENDINQLISSGKDCKYYRCPNSGTLNFLWGGYFIVNTELIFYNSIFNNTDWYSSKEKWVRTFNIGFFESIVETIINKSIIKENIICSDISEEVNKLWNEDDYLKVSTYKINDSEKFKKEVITDNLIVKILPYLINDDFELYLYVFNNDSNDFTIHNIEVIFDNNLLYSVSDKTINSKMWFIDKLLDNVKNKNGTLKCTYYLKNSLNEFIKNEIIFEVKNIPIINEKLMRIEFY